jgi:hypothetical protein
LTVISKRRINIKVEESLKIATTEVIPKVLREIHTETAEISFKKKVIPKTLSSIAPRDIGSITDQDIGLKTT